MPQGKLGRQIITFLLCLAAGSLSAQTPSTGTTQGHSMASPNMIDGSTNPSAISDRAAHRLFYIALGVLADASADEKGRQDAHLKKVGLNTDDRKAVAAALADFKNQYQGFMNRWNEAAEAAIAKNQPFDPTPFLKQRDALVQSTRSVLASKLSAEGMALLLQHISAEKSKMRVDVREAQ